MIGARARPVAALVAALLLLAACGGTGTLGAKEYFAALEEIGQRLEEGNVRLVEEADSPGGSPSHRLMMAVVEGRRDYLEEIEELTPPGEVADRHGLLVDRLVTALDIWERFLAETGDLDEEGFVEALSASPELDRVWRALSQACLDLQAASVEFLETRAELGC